MAKQNPNPTVIEMIGAYKSGLGVSMILGIGQQDGLYRFEGRDPDGWTHVHSTATPYRKVAIRWARKFLAAQDRRA